MSTGDRGGAASTAALQGELGSARARDWAKLHEHLHAPLYQATFQAMGVGAGMRLLDAGCGSGVAAARGVQVTGIDAATALVALARIRLPPPTLAGCGAGSTWR
jgi:2-polyprenyl-3-methyl-5-hydroxy-6-metoxy-1,4-benzoquinol methylase